MRATRFVPRKNWIVTGSDDMAVRVFNYNTLERVHMFEAHSDYLRCIAVHPTQPFILTSSDDMSIKLWNWEKNWQCEQVFEGHTHLGTYMLDDSFPEVDNLGIDHVNTLSVAADGEVALSVFGFDGVVSVDGDPASPTFLQMNWHASGSPGGDDDLPDPDYVPEGDERAFFKQHNAGMYDGRLWLYDNLSRDTSRVVVFSLDDERGRLVEESSWAMDRVCRQQGGALPVDGGALATCSNDNLAWLFPEDSDAPVWTISATCGPGWLQASTRAYPVKVE